MPIITDIEHIKKSPLSQYNDTVGVCILAAGIAKRLEPISAVIAKPAFPLGGRVPIAELWVRKFVDAGLSKIVMNLHRVPDSLIAHFGSGNKFSADINYVYEEKPSGTLGGAIKMVKKFHEEGFYPKRVFIPSGDIVSGIGNEHLEMMMYEHVKRGAAFTMMLAPIPWDRRGDFGTAVLEDVSPGVDVPPGTFSRIEDFIEKDPNSPSNENNASNYLIETDFLLELEQYLTEPRFDIEQPCYDVSKHLLMGMKGKVPYLDFLQKRSDDLYGYDPGSLWFDVGNKRDYLLVNKKVLHGEIQINLPYIKYPWGWLGDNVELDFNNVTIYPPVVIGNNCSIAPGAEIGPNVVLGDGWIILRDAIIRNTVLWPYYNFNGSPNHNIPSISRIREVREGLKIETSVIVGGIINDHIYEKTVDMLPNGKLDIKSIDWIPKGPRA